MRPTDDQSHLGHLWQSQPVDIPFGLTGGGPSHKTEVIAVTLYDQAFRLLDAGFASSIATVVLVFNLIAAVSI